jgi:hypothetical protein
MSDLSLDTGRADFFDEEEMMREIEAGIERVRLDPSTCVDAPAPVASTTTPARPCHQAVERFLETLPEVTESQWPNRLLMEIECITDPVELEAVKILIDERIEWLTK